MSERILCSSLPVPEAIEYRCCSKDWGHWMSDGERCPVCNSKIRVVRFVPTSDDTQSAVSATKVPPTRKEALNAAYDRVRNDGGKPKP